MPLPKEELTEAATPHPWALGREKRSTSRVKSISAPSAAGCWPGTGHGTALHLGVLIQNNGGRSPPATPLQLTVECSRKQESLVSLSINGMAAWLKACLEHLRAASPAVSTGRSGPHYQGLETEATRVPHSAGPSGLKDGPSHSLVSKTAKGKGGLGSLGRSRASSHLSEAEKHLQWIRIQRQHRPLSLGTPGPRGR